MHCSPAGCSISVISYLEDSVHSGDSVHSRQSPRHTLAPVRHRSKSSLANESNWDLVASGSVCTLNLNQTVSKKISPTLTHNLCKDYADNKPCVKSTVDLWLEESGSSDAFRVARFLNHKISCLCFLFPNLRTWFRFSLEFGHIRTWSFEVAHCQTRRSRVDWHTTSPVFKSRSLSRE